MIANTYIYTVGGVDLPLAKLGEPTKSLCGTASVQAGCSVVDVAKFVQLLEIDPEDFDETVDLEMGHLVLYSFGKNQCGFTMDDLIDILKIYRDDNSIAYDIFYGLLSIAINVVTEARS